MCVEGTGVGKHFLSEFQEGARPLFHKQEGKKLFVGPFALESCISELKQTFPTVDVNYLENQTVYMSNSNYSNMSKKITGVMSIHQS